MKKNKIYIILAILTTISLFAVSAICNQCAVAPEEEEKIGVEEEEEAVAEEEAVEEEAVAEEEVTEEEEAEEAEEEEGTVVEEKEVPTITLAIYEGPTYSSADGVCYYSIKATVTGSPSPDVDWSKDDSHGAWGTKKAQVNLHDPDETYTLTATATNSEGSDTDSIELSWGCEEEEEEAPETTAVAFSVTSVTASVSPTSYTGMCPAEFTWSAIITVNAPGTVTYQWEVEGGSPDPPKSLTFSSAGSQTITKSCNLSCGWPNTTLWRQVRIISPNEMVSNQATETLTCYPDIDVRPPTTVNFGAVACGSSAAYGVIIENVSSGKLDISSVNITLGSSFFSIEDDPCTGSSLFIGQQCTITIKFGPLSVCSPAGAKYGGILRIRSNDPDEGTVNVTLTATQS